MEAGAIYIAIGLAAWAVGLWFFFGPAIRRALKDRPVWPRKRRKGEVIEMDNRRRKSG